MSNIVQRVFSYTISRNKSFQLRLKYHCYLFKMHILLASLSVSVQHHDLIYMFGLQGGFGSHVQMKYNRVYFCYDIVPALPRIWMNKFINILSMINMIKHACVMKVNSQIYARNCWFRFRFKKSIKTLAINSQNLKGQTEANMLLKYISLLHCKCCI